jgi:hypothetical protein
MPGVADHAYSHCLAVLGDPAAAAEASAIAIRHGGRARWAVLAHARHEALERLSTAARTPDAGAELVDVARWLAGSRPAEERSLLDLADRHDLDRGALGRVWGIPPADAAAQVATVTEAWGRELDPVVLAWLGPGECDDMAAILRAAGVAEAGSAVVAHAATCDACGDRMRAMVSVRTLLGTAPLEAAPVAVASTSRRRRRRPLPVPAAPRRPSKRLWTAAAAAAVVGVAAAVVFVTAGNDATDGAPGRLESLTALPSGESALVVQPNRVAAVAGSAAAPVVLRNRSERPVSWTGAAPEWVRVLPARGDLAPGEAARIRIDLGKAAPEGEIRTTITFSADDGSSAAVQFESTVERPPDIDASAQACEITAAVEDEADVTAVHLHWRASSEEAAPMIERDDVWTGLLPSSADGLAWWVTATDARGNAAATISTELAPLCGRT